MPRDEAWFEGLYRRHHRAIDAYCVRRVGRVDASDAVAQVFATAWRRRDDVPDDDAATRWLYGVARRVLAHHWRSGRRALRLAERAGVLRPQTPPSAETMAVASADQRMVREAVMGMPPRDREVLLLSAWEGLTHAEIAEVLDCSVAAIDKRSARAKRRLADRFTSLAGQVDGPTAERSPAQMPYPVRARKGGGAP